MRCGDAKEMVREFKFGCKRWKRKTELLGWAIFARWFDIDELMKILWLKTMMEIMCDEDYFYLLFNF